MTLQGTQRPRTMEQSWYMFALPLDAKIEAGQCLLEPLELIEQHAASTCRLKMVRVELQNLLIDEQRIRRTVERHQRPGELFP